MKKVIKIKKVQEKERKLVIQRRKKLTHPKDINLVIIIVIAEAVVTMTITMTVINDTIIPKKKKGI